MPTQVKISLDDAFLEDLLGIALSKMLPYWIDKNGLSGSLDLAWPVDLVLQQGAVLAKARLRADLRKKILGDLHKVADVRAELDVSAALRVDSTSALVLRTSPVSLSYDWSGRPTICVGDVSVSGDIAKAILDAVIEEMLPKAYEFLTRELDLVPILAAVRKRVTDLGYDFFVAEPTIAVSGMESALQIQFQSKHTEWIGSLGPAILHRLPESFTLTVDIGREAPIQPGTDLTAIQLAERLAPLTQFYLPRLLCDLACVAEQGVDIANGSHVGISGKWGVALRGPRILELSWSSVDLEIRLDRRLLALRDAPRAPLPVMREYVLGARVRTRIPLFETSTLSDSQREEARAIIEDAWRDWISEWGFVEIDRLSNPTRERNENPVLFTAEFVYLAWRLGLLSGSFASRVRKMVDRAVDGLRLTRGLFDRYPVGVETVRPDGIRTFSRDEQIGLLTLDWIFDGTLGFAQELLDYGEESSWIYQNSPVLPSSGPLQRWDLLVDGWRGPEFRALIKASLGKAIAKAEAVQICLGLEQGMQEAPSETGGRILTYLRAEILAGADPLLDRALIRFHRSAVSMYGVSPLGALMRMYFKRTGQPSRELAQLLGPETIPERLSRGALGE